MDISLTVGLVLVILVPVGEILMGLGYLCAWRATEANGIAMLWAMIILVSIGTGFFKGNVSGINGRLFPLADQDELDTVFNLQYMFVNIGSFCGTTFLSFHLLERALDTVLCSWFVESSCSSTAYGGSLE